jgi:HEPN domain-containing protein
MNVNDASWKNWLIFADEDLSMAEDLARDGHHGGACFHAQQSVEKGFKTVIFFLGYEREKTHNLLTLANVISSHFPQINAFQKKITDLNAFYMTTRYPDGIPLQEKPKMFNEKESQAAIEAANEILEFVKKLLKDEV